MARKKIQLSTWFYPEEKDLILRNASNENKQRDRYVMDAVKFYEDWKWLIHKYGPAALDFFLEQSLPLQSPSESLQDAEEV